MSHPRHDLDGLLLHPVRLSVVAALAGVDSAEFALVRDCVEVSDSVLSKQVALLEAAGYLEVTKGKVARRPRTWLGLTPAGDIAYRTHMRALQATAAATPTATRARVSAGSPANVANEYTRQQERARP